jgi:hypothetical protein
LLEALDGVVFHTFDPARHVTKDAEFNPNLPVYAAIDAGVSRYTGAILYQIHRFRDGVGAACRDREVMHVFGDYFAVDLYSEANALAIQEVAKSLCLGRHASQQHRPGMPGGIIDHVFLDPMSSARTGTGPAARGEYLRVFGDRVASSWPLHSVQDGIDQVELLLGPPPPKPNEPPPRPPDLYIHPRCENLISALNSYRWAERKGEFQTYPEDPAHPEEDMCDALRGAVRATWPEGRTPQPNFRRVDARKIF